jgi:small subunit ribosomal protein S1
MDKIKDKDNVSNENPDSFKDLMEEFEGKISEIEINDKVTGIVLEKKGEYTFLDLGGRLDGRIKTEHIEVAGDFSVGDEIDVFVTGVREGFYSCSLNGAASTDQIPEDGDSPGFETDSTVVGKITDHNKGGFEVNVGGTKCFSPFSKMDWGAGENPDEYVGKVLKFVVEEIDDEKSRYILSRREIIRIEKDKKKREFLNMLEEGKVYSGTVKSIMNYGAFVEVGEIEGLLHISDISHEKVKDINEVLKIDDEIEVVLKKNDRETGKISFSMKELTPEPWEEFAGKFSVGDKIEGTVETLKPYGAFVKVFPGVSGLLHISKLGTGKFHQHPKEVFRVGDKVNVWIDKISEEDKRISLTGESPETDYSNQIRKINEESENEGKNSSSSAFGKMLDNALNKGKK